MSSEEKMSAIWNKLDNIGQDTAKIDGLQQSITGITSRVDKVDEEVSELKQRTQELDEEIESMKSYQRKNNLIITGVPEQLLGNCINVIIDIAYYLDVKLDETYIDAAHPLPTRHGTKIVVKFINRWIKERILNAYITEAKKGGLKTTALSYEGPSQHVYISEHLTPKTEQIYYEARQLKRANKIQTASVRNGKVVVKKSGSALKITIASLDDLKKLKLEGEEN